MGRTVLRSDKRRAVSCTMTLKPLSYVWLRVKVYLDGHVSINHFSPEN